MKSPLSRPGKRLEARQKLEKLIRSQSLWSQQLMGERELAAELSIGRKTVRAVLADLEADGVVERRHGAGTFVVPKGGSRRRSAVARLAVIAEIHFEQSEGWSYQGEMILGVLGQAPRARAECTVLALDRPEEAELVGSDSQMRRFDGFVVASPLDRDLISRLLALRSGPVVLLDHQFRDLPIVGVVDGSFEGAKAVARHLLALGHRRIAFIDCPGREALNPEKFAGYRAALSQKGLPLDEALVIVAPEARSGPILEQFIDGEIERLLGLPDPPTAIFGFDDNRALPAMKALERRGLVVGKDYSVAGFGDGAIRQGLCDRLTSCRIYPRKMGREALLAALGGRSPEHGRTVIVPDRLYVRASTCPPGGGK
jgi:LacI family transcriptional regulator